MARLKITRVLKNEPVQEGGRWDLSAASKLSMVQGKFYNPDVPGMCE